MANYIGNEPLAGEFKRLDSIESQFNGSLTSFNLQYNSTTTSAGDASTLFVSLNGVIQEPLEAYTLSHGGSKVVFSSAPAAGAECYIVQMGAVGGTATPSDTSVTHGKLDATVGAIVPSSLGTAGQVLTVNSGATAATFADAGGGADLYSANESSPAAQPSATGTNAIAIGDSALAVGTNSFSGPKSHSSGYSSFAVAIDNNSTSYGAKNSEAIAMGYRSIASGVHSVSIGRDGNASGAYGISLGYDANATGGMTLSIGHNNDVTHYQSAALGKSITSTADYQVSIGGSTQDVRISEVYTLPKVDGTNGQVLTTDGSGAVTFADAGGGADLYAANESSPTAQPSATGTNAIAIGDSAVSTGTDSFALGKARATGDRSIAIHTGTNSSYGATTGDCIAIGEFAKATTSMAVAIGRSASATGSQSVSLGFVATATGTQSTAIQRGLASGADSFAAHITNSTTSYGASGARSIAMGTQAKANSSDAISLGYLSLANAEKSFAIGSRVQAYGQYSFALGHRSLANEIGKLAYTGTRFTSNGDSQQGTFVLLSDTTDATAEALTTSNGTAASNNQVVLPNNSAYTFSGTIVAREKASEGTDVGAWEVKGIIRREANAGTTVLVNSVINELNVPTGWAVAVSADTTNGALAVTVTGVASTNIRWVATIQTSEVIYA